MTRVRVVVVLQLRPISLTRNHCAEPHELRRIVTAWVLRHELFPSTEAHQPRLLPLAAVRVVVISWLELVVGVRARFVPIIILTCLFDQAFLAVRWIVTQPDLVVDAPEMQQR